MKILAVGTEVSAKYKGAFCEARIKKVTRLVKCRISFKNQPGFNIVSDEYIKGSLRVGARVEAKHPEKNVFMEGLINKIMDASQYTVVFDDGDEATLRRTSLCLKSGKHFAESESLDHLPLTNPEHFGNPVNLGVRGRRSRRRHGSNLNSSYSLVSDGEDNESAEGDGVQAGSGVSLDDEDSESNLTQQSGSIGNTKDDISEQDIQKEQDLGKVVCVEYSDKRGTKAKDVWFPALTVSANSSENIFINTKEEYLVKSFKDDRFYQVLKSEAKEFTKEAGLPILNDSSSSASLRTAIEKALLYVDKSELPANWDYDVLLGNGALPTVENDAGVLSSEFDTDDDFDEDDNEPSEEKDRFVAQLYKFMDERGTPINKAPVVATKELDFYRLYRLVNKIGGYNRVTNKNLWSTIYAKMNLPACTDSVTENPSINQLKLAYKRFLLSFDDFYRKLGCTMPVSSRTSSRLTRNERSWRGNDGKDRDVAAPKTRRKRNVANEGEKKDDAEAMSEKSDKTDKQGSAEEEEKSIKKAKRKTGTKYGKKKSSKLSSIDGDAEGAPNDGGKDDRHLGMYNSDSDCDNDVNSKTPTIGKEESVNIGDRIRVKYGKGKQLKVYEAKILKEDKESDYLKRRYYVHYTGWNTRYDEWIYRSRIVEVVRDKSPKRRGNKQKNKGVPINEEDTLEKDTKDKESKDAPTKRGRPLSANKTEEVKVASKESGKKEGAKGASSLSGKRVKQKSDATEESKTPPLASPETSEPPPVCKMEAETEDSPCPESASPKSQDPSKVYEFICEESIEKTTEDEFSGVVKVESVSPPEPTDEEETKEVPEPVSNEDIVLTCHEDLGRSPLSKPEIADVFVESDAKGEVRDVKKEVEPKTAEEGTADAQLVKGTKRKRKEAKDLPKKEKKKPTASDKEAPPKKKKIKKSSDDSEQGTAEEAKEKSPKNSKKKKKIESSAESDDTGGSGSAEPDTKTVKRKRSSGAPKAKNTDSQSKSSKSSGDEVKEESNGKTRPKREPGETKKTGEAKEKILDEEESLEVASIFEDPQSKDVYAPVAERSSSNEMANEGLSFLLCKEEVPASPVPMSENVEPFSDCKPSHDLRNQDFDEAPIKTSPEHDEPCPSVYTCSKEQRESKNVDQKQNQNETVQFTPPATPENAKNCSSVTLTPPHDRESNDGIEYMNHSAILSTESPGTESDNGPNLLSQTSSGCSFSVKDEHQSHATSITISQKHAEDAFQRCCTEGNTSKKSEVPSPPLVSPMTSPRKKRRGRIRTSSTSESTCKETRQLTLKTRTSSSRRTRQHADCTPDPYSFNSDVNAPLSPLASSISLSNYSPNGFVYSVTPTSKYNFCTPIDENLDAEKRIQIITERLRDLKRTYLSLKSEVASIERRRKKAKKKDRERVSPTCNSHHGENKLCLNGESSSRTEKDGGDDLTPSTRLTKANGCSSTS